MSAVPTGLSSSYTALIPFSFVPDGIRCVRDMYSRVAGRGCGKATRVRLVPHRTRTGTCSKRRPRRDNVSPFEPGRDRPQRAPRSQSFKTPEKNGDMFQAPPRRDYVSPFEPEGSHGGLPLQGEADGQSRMRRRCPPILAAPKRRPRIARGLARRPAARPE